MLRYAKFEPTSASMERDAKGLQVCCVH